MKKVRLLIQISNQHLSVLLTRCEFSRKILDSPIKIGRWSYQQLESTRLQSCMTTRTAVDRPHKAMSCAVVGTIINNLFQRNDARLDWPGQKVSKK
jgi:hypothetical protein